MAIEIVDFPIKNGDFPLLCDSSPEGSYVSHYQRDNQNRNGQQAMMGRSSTRNHPTCLELEPAQEPLKQVAFKEVPPRRQGDTNAATQLEPWIGQKMTRWYQMVFSMMSFLESVSSGMKEGLNMEPTKGRDLGNNNGDLRTFLTFAESAFLQETSILAGKNK